MSKIDDRLRKMENVKKAVDELENMKEHKDTLRDLMIDISYKNNEIIDTEYDGDVGAAYTDRALICLYEGEYPNIWCPMRDQDAISEVDPFEHYGMDFVLRTADMWLVRERAKMAEKKAQDHNNKIRSTILDKLLGDFDIAHFYAKHARIMADTNDVAKHIAHILDRHDFPDDHVFELSIDMSGKCYYLFNPNHDLDHVESIQDYDSIGLFELYTTFARLRQLAQ